MPELPEVETIRRDLEDLILHRTIHSLDVQDARLMNQRDVKRWREVIVGTKLSGFKRKGKYLLMILSNDYQVVVHLRMTGQLIVSDSTPSTKPRWLLELSGDKFLGLYDQRRFAEVWLLSPSETLREDNPLGPDALTELNLERLAAALRGRTTPVHTLLMDQRRVAGIGNIYAQEALFKAAIRPTRASRRLSVAERSKLLDALKETLETAITHRGSTSRNYRDATGSSGSAQTLHNVYRKAGKPCPLCRMILRGIRVGGRGSVFCPRCQK